MENIGRKDLFGLQDELHRGWGDWLTTREVLDKLLKLLLDGSDDMTQEEAEGIVAGLRDAAAGRVKPIEQIRKEKELAGADAPTGGGR